MGNLDLEGIDVNTSFFEPAEYIQDSSDNLRTVLIIGLVLLALALAAFLFDLRSAFVALVAVILSMSAAVVVLWFRDETLNSMVLAGLVLALVVVIDDAITTADAIRRGGARNGAVDDDVSVTRRILDAVLPVRAPLAYGTAIVLLMIVPILVLEGEPGAFMPPLVLSYTGAVIAAFIVALTVTPALSMMLLARAEPARTSPALGFLQPRYDRGVGTFTRTIRPGIIAGVALLVVGLVVLPFVDRGDSVVPDFEDRSLLVQWEGAPGVSLPEMQRITARAGQEIGDLDGVDSVGGHVGRAILGDQALGVNSSEALGHGGALGELRRHRVVDRSGGRGIPGSPQHGVDLPTAAERCARHAQRGRGQGPHRAGVRGQPRHAPRSDRRRRRAAVDDIDGAQDVVVDLPIVEPTLDVEVDLDRAQAFGIKPGDVRRTAATMFNGIIVGNLFEEQKIFEVTVEGADDLRGSVDDVRNLLLDLPNGGQVPLSSVADVTVSSAPNVIDHQDISRYIDIGLDVSGRDVDAVAGDIEVAIGEVDFPIEYHAEVIDDYEDTRSDRLLFIGLAIGALVGVFLLLQAALSSWVLAALLFVALPGALTGGLIGALIDGDDVTIGTLVGFLAVYALAVRASVVFVKRCHTIEDRRSEVLGAQGTRTSASIDDEGDLFGPGLVRNVAAERLGPTIATAVAIVVVFIPLAFMGGADFEVIGPMAAVVLGGVITTALFSLFVVPTLYLGFGKRAEDTRRPVRHVLGPAPRGRSPASKEPDRRLGQMHGDDEIDAEETHAMSVRQRWLAGALVVVALAAAGCSESGASDDSSGDAAAYLEEVDGEAVERDPGRGGSGAPRARDGGGVHAAGRDQGRPVRGGRLRRRRRHLGLHQPGGPDVRARTDRGHDHQR